MVRFFRPSHAEIAADLPSLCLNVWRRTSALTHGTDNCWTNTAATLVSVLLLLLSLMTSWIMHRYGWHSWLSLFWAGAKPRLIWQSQQEIVVCAFRYICGVITNNRLLLYCAFLLPISSGVESSLQLACHFHHHTTTPPISQSFQKLLMLLYAYTLVNVTTSNFFTVSLCKWVRRYSFFL